MSEAVKGVVEQVFFREIAGGPDKYGKTHRVSVKVQEVWYGFGSTVDKGYGLSCSVKDGTDWHGIAEGDTLQFFAKGREHKGKTFWDKDGAAKLVSAGGKQAATYGKKDSAKPASESTGQAAPSRNARDPNPEYAVGRWVNGATGLVSAGKAKDLQDGIMQMAKIEVWVTDNFAAIMDKARGGQPKPVTEDKDCAKEEAKPAPKKASRAVAEESDDDFSDDIPF